MAGGRLRGREVRVHLSLIALAVGVIAFAATWPIRDTSPWWGLVPLGLLFLALMAAWRSWMPIDWPPHTPAGNATSVQAFADVRAAESSLVVSAEFLRDPSSYTPRIVHEVTPEDEYLLNVVTRELTLPALYKGDAAEHTYYVPLLYLERGTLIDNLSTHSSDGLRVPIVASSLARALTYQLLALLTERQFAPEQSNAVRFELEKLRPVLMSDASVIHGDAEMEAARQALDRLSGFPAPLTAAPTWKADREAVIKLWVATFSSYVIFGELVATPRSMISVSVSYSKPIRTSEPRGRDESWVTSVKDILRSVLGVRPYVYRFPLQYERATASYHLRFVGPDDQYVVRTELIRRSLGSDGSSPCHLVVSRTDESSTLHYAHIYVRPLRDVTGAGELRLRIAMRERPPGMLGLTALVGAAQLAVQAVVLIYYGRLFPTTHNPSDLPAFILAAPAVVSTWMANQIAPGRLRRMPLTAVAGIFFNGLSGLTATMLAVLAAYGTAAGPIDVGSLVINHPDWIGLLAVSIWAVGNVALRWAQSTILFTRRLRRGPILDRYAI